MGTETGGDLLKKGEFTVVKAGKIDVELVRYLNTPPRSLRQFWHVPKPTGGSIPPHSTSMLIAKLM